MVNEIARFQRFSRVSGAGSLRPGLRRTTCLVDCASGQSVQCPVAGEPPRHALEQIGGEDAVVVGEGDEIGADVFQSRVAGAGEPSLGMQPHEIERALFPQDRLETIVLVLVDEQDANGAVRLRLD